jgi:hypothetical protein
MRRPSACLTAALCLLALGAAGLAADPAQPAPLQTRLKRVALFKNGLAFFVREGTLSSAGQNVLLGPFAAPAHGTFWVTSPRSAGLSSVVARKVAGDEKVEARELVDLLRANVGRLVTVWLTSDPESAITGKIISFAPDRLRQTPDPYALGAFVDPSQILPPGRGQYLLLQTEDGAAVALDPYRATQLRFSDPDISTTFSRETEQVELHAALDSPKPGDWLSVSYLAKGATWAPSYLIDISDAKQARLSAKALVINEAEDLDGAHVDLITGFPNLRFADTLSPMGMRDNLAAFLQSLVGGPQPRARGVVTQNVMFAGEAMAGVSFRLPDYAAAAAGQIAEDLFLYPLEDITLAKGDTGYYPLFTQTVPYTEFYHWEIPDYINERDRYGERQREERDTPEEVWHSIRLTNTMQLPWTTAPAQLMKDGQIIGQDTLNYTPPKGESTVKITQAVSVKAEQTEVETARDREALRMYGDYFDRVTIEGTLKVTNFKPKLVSLEIQKTLSGDFKGTSHTAQDTTLARGLARMNPTHLLTWNIDLKPGEAKEITYTYQALIRR